jgi:hypothetical protein
MKNSIHVISPKKLDRFFIQTNIIMLKKKFVEKLFSFEK